MASSNIFFLAFLIRFFCPSTLDTIRRVPVENHQQNHNRKNHPQNHEVRVGVRFKSLITGEWRKADVQQERSERREMSTGSEQ